MAKKLRGNMLAHVVVERLRLLSAIFSRKQISFRLAAHGKFRQASQEIYIFSSPDYHIYIFNKSMWMFSPSSKQFIKNAGS